MKHSSFSSILMLFSLCACLALCSCGNKEPSDTSNRSPQNPSSIAEASPSTNNASNHSTQKDSTNDVSNIDASTEVPLSSTRGDKQLILLACADGTVVYGNSSVTIDASNTSEGYVMVNYTGSNSKVKFQLTGTDNVTYTYNLHGGYEVFPLTSGNGTYKLGVFENIEGTSYSTLFTQSIDVTITNEFGPFLYANQYVNFTASSTAVEKSSELSATANSDLEVVESVYNYIIDNFTYDYDKAATVQSGYLPVVDEIMSSQTGICFDYAAVMATMLRTQNIPTRLEVGYMEDVYHAWISTYIEDKGWINGIIEFDGTEWKLMDPTFASTSSKPQNFLTETDQYMTKYVY